MFFLSNVHVKRKIKMENEDFSFKRIKLIINGEKTHTIKNIKDCFIKDCYLKKKFVILCK